MVDLPGKLEFTGGAGADRRQAARILRAVDLNFRVCALPGEQDLISALDKLLVAQSHDLSETGVCMWTTRVLVPASTIELEFPGTSGEPPFRAKARVVWCQPHAEGGYLKSRMGLEFVDLTPELRARLLKIISG